MNATFMHYDGQGNLYNDEGMAVTIVEMEVDEEDTRAPDIRKHYKDSEKEQ
ncbi:hypothetical protein BD408DRAFT_147065 [Parasitella parasitica]|nr:hypothetical protein BD408DRAFT_364460 [Parasitella parasitica]KAI8643756.1 hypothetical protein BD408DRAFT_147065 [Parasitella parasitica]